jgi:hypothetical protein
MISGKRFKTPQPPQPPYAVLCDEMMETWTPFSSRHEMRPRNARENPDQVIYDDCPDLEPDRQGIYPIHFIYRFKT